MIDLTYNKNQNLISKNIIKNQEKFIKQFDLKKNQEKLLNIFNNELTKFNNYNCINNNYITISSLSYTKVLTLILLTICKQTFNDKKQIPHIIITYYESNYIINICKQLLKNNIINLSIIKGINIVDELKLLKNNNTKIVIISNLNSNINYNLKKIYTYCKYYNILFLSNIENNYFNFSNSPLYFINQDIILINYNKYIFNTKNSIIYHIIIKKDIINKFNLNDIISKHIISKNNFNLLILLNLIEINKHNKLEIYKNNLNSIKELYDYTFNQIKSKYNIISYSDLIKSKSIYYFYNTITLITLNNIENILYNYINFSIFIPNISFTNKLLNNYFKSKLIILEPSFRFFINNNDKYYEELKKGSISIILNLNTKITEINKFLIILDEFIEMIFYNKKIKVSKKKKKHVQFINPEFIICKKKYSPNKNQKKIKSILK